MRYADLGELRRKLLHLSPATVSRHAALPVTRLEEIEGGDAPTILEAEKLGGVYGIDADLLMDQPIVLEPTDAVSVLALLDEFQEVSADTKVAILSAATAARDLVTLKARLGDPDPWSDFVASFRLPRARGDATPFAQGRHYANALRRKLRLGDGPIPSVRDLVRNALPSIAVLYADLFDAKLSGVTFVDRIRGPTIVLNIQGKNCNPGVRRFSLAHELCHVLVDTDRAEPLASLSGFLSDGGLDRERRANAFAARLLCPEEVVHELASDGLGAARVLIEEYGFHYQAARLYLRNVIGVELPPQPPAGLIGAELSSRWHLAEEALGLVQLPIADVPAVRRTEVAVAAARSYAEGTTPRDAFARLLGVTPAHDLESVLAYFGLDAPTDDDVPH